MVDYRKLNEFVNKIDTFNLYGVLFKRWLTDSDINSAADYEYEQSFLWEKNPFDKIRYWYGMCVPAYCQKISGYPLESLVGGYDWFFKNNEGSVVIDASLYLSGSCANLLYSVIAEAGEADIGHIFFENSTLNACRNMPINIMTDEQFHGIAEALYSVVCNYGDCSDCSVSVIEDDMRDYAEVTDEYYKDSNVIGTVAGYLYGKMCAGADDFFNDCIDGAYSNTKMWFCVVSDNLLKMEQLYSENSDSLTEYKELIELYRQVIGELSVGEISYQNVHYIVMWTHDVYDSVDESALIWSQAYVYLPLLRLFTLDADNICASMEAKIKRKKKGAQNNGAS